MSTASILPSGERPSIFTYSSTPASNVVVNGASRDGGCVTGKRGFWVLLLSLLVACGVAWFVCSSLGGGCPWTQWFRRLTGQQPPKHNKRSGGHKKPAAPPSRARTPAGPAQRTPMPRQAQAKQWGIGLHGAGIKHGNPPVVDESAYIGGVDPVQFDAEHQCPKPAQRIPTATTSLGGPVRAATTSSGPGAKAVPLKTGDGSNWSEYEGVDTSSMLPYAFMHDKSSSRPQPRPDADAEWDSDSDDEDGDIEKDWIRTKPPTRSDFERYVASAGAARDVVIERNPLGRQTGYVDGVAALREPIEIPLRKGWGVLENEVHAMLLETGHDSVYY